MTTTGSGGFVLPSSPGPFRFRVLWDREHYPEGVDSLTRSLLCLRSDPNLDASIRQLQSHLVMVLDVSGSMDVPDKYPLLRDALQLMMENFEDGLFLTLVLFSSEPHVLCEALPAVRVRADSATLLRRMDTSPVRFRMTHVSEALRHALTAVRGFRSTNDAAVPRIYVLTDGQIQDAEECLLLRDAFVRANVEVNSFGFGGDFAFESIRAFTDGMPGSTIKHIRTNADIRERFRRVVQVSSLIAASGCGLELRLAEGVVPGDFFSHRPATKLWPATSLAGCICPRFEIGLLEAQREYVWAFEARLPPGVRHDFAMGEIALTGTRDAGSFEQTWPFEARIAAAGDPGVANPDVERVLTSLEDLRDNDPKVQILAYRARVDLFRAEGRDPDHIRALERIVEKLERGERKEEIEPDLVRRADVHADTFIGFMKSDESPPFPPLPGRGAGSSP